MPKYLITSTLEEEIIAEDEGDALIQFLEMVEGEPQETIASYFTRKLKAIEIK